MASEPAVAATYHAAPCVESEIPYDVDFGYPRTVEELKVEVERAVSERNDSSKWDTWENFMGQFKQKHPQWFR